MTSTISLTGRSNRQRTIMMKYRRRPRRRWQLRIGRLSARLKHHDPGSQLRHQVTQLRQPKGPGPVPAHHRSQKGPILTSPPSWTWSRSWRYRAPGWSARPCRNPGARSSQAAIPLSRASLSAGPAADHQPQYVHLPGTSSAQTSRPQPQPSAAGRPHPDHQQAPCRHHQ